MIEWMRQPRSARIMHLTVATLILSGCTQFIVAQDDGSLITVDRRNLDYDVKTSRSLTGDERSNQRRSELVQEFSETTSLDHGATIHPSLMQTVKDNSIGIRYEERDAYLRTLRLAKEVPLRNLKEFASELRSDQHDANPLYRRRRPDDFPQFVDLFTHPDQYRGRPVTLRGILRKLTKFDVGPNKQGLDRVYEGWVYTDDSQGNPTVVVFTSKDDRLQVAGDLQEEVTFTGYFFKMYGYDAYDLPRKAPLILAGEVEWFPHRYRGGLEPWRIEWYGLTTLAFFLGLCMLWQSNRLNMPSRQPLQIEPDFTHLPPREHPLIDPHLPHTMLETEDS